MFQTRPNIPPWSRFGYVAANPKPFPQSTLTIAYGNWQADELYKKLTAQSGDLVLTTKCLRQLREALKIGEEVVEAHKAGILGLFNRLLRSDDLEIRTLTLECLRWVTNDAFGRDKILAEECPELLEVLTNLLQKETSLRLKQALSLTLHNLSKTPPGAAQLTACKYVDTLFAYTCGDSALKPGQGAASSCPSPELVQQNRVDCLLIATLAACVKRCSAGQRETLGHPGESVMGLLNPLIALRNENGHEIEGLIEDKTLAVLDLLFAMTILDINKDRLLAADCIASLLQILTQQRVDEAPPSDESVPSRDCPLWSWQVRADSWRLLGSLCLRRQGKYQVRDMLVTSFGKVVDEEAGEKGSGTGLVLLKQALITEDSHLLLLNVLHTLSLVAEDPLARRMLQDCVSSVRALEDHVNPSVQQLAEKTRRQITWTA